MNEKMDELINLYEGYFEDLSRKSKEELERGLEDLLEVFKDCIEEERFSEFKEE